MGLISQVPPHVCVQGCGVRHPVCSYGQEVCQAANCLANLVPDPFPDNPTQEQMDAIVTFWYLRKLWMFHIGQEVKGERNVFRK